jgi:MFS family permease
LQVSEFNYISFGKSPLFLDAPNPLTSPTGLIRFTGAVAWTSIFPYSYFMIRSFCSISEDNVALFADLLVSVFTFAEFLSAMPWAWVADRIRRRYTLLIGIVGSIVSAAVFGLSRNIALAAVTRAVGGLMNPNVGVVQTCTGELATRKDQQGGAISCYGFRCELRSCSKSFSNCALSSGPWVGICCVCV